MDCIEVTQADRDRAMSILNFAFRNTDVEISVECFDDMALELARHRIAAINALPAVAVDDDIKRLKAEIAAMKAEDDRVTNSQMADLKRHIKEQQEIRDAARGSSQ